MAKATGILKQALHARRAMIVPGAPNALFARIIADLGFEAVYVTGAGLANMRFGLPDIGLTTLTELVQTTAEIADSTDLPLIVDMDTGFGNPLNVVRALRMLERAGAAAVQIEDQVFPKKCGHFQGKAVIPAAEMIDKIKAAVDTRRDHDLQIIARSDARACEGLPAAIDRAAAYLEAGADASFVEAPASAEELAQIARSLPAPQIANIVHGGRTPDPGQAALAQMGFGAVLYANAALQAAMHGAQQVLGLLKTQGSLAGGAALLAGFDDRQRMVGKSHWDALEARFAAKGAPD
jgi:2-methylisocitrate lyase-like PEP mutase family enzyme